MATHWVLVKKRADLSVTNENEIDVADLLSTRVTVANLQQPGVVSPLLVIGRNFILG